jgi:hypothetical protein
MTQEPQLLIPVSLAQALVDFLKQRPFQEVHSLVGSLMRAPRAEVQAPAPVVEKPHPTSIRMSEDSDD